MEPSVKKQYSSEYKTKMVGLAEQGQKSTAQVSRDLGVNVEILRRWVKEFGVKLNGKAAIKSGSSENRRSSST